MTDNKRHVLFLDTGYKYDMEVTYGSKLRQLSERFRGTVVTYGEIGFHRFGNFSVHSFSILRSKVLIFVRAYLHAVRLIRKSRRRGRPVDLLISYDPLNTGLLGLLISWTCGVPLIVEINGDYTNWSNYAEIRNLQRRRLKRWFYIKTEGFVLMRAAGIKLLYSAQLEYFRRRLQPRGVIKTFPNFLDLTEFRNIGESNTVVIVGFPFFVKGIDIAIAAFKLVADEFPDWKLEVLGWYKGPEKQLLDDCIAGHAQISHHEKIFKRDMPDYLGKVGVVLCASRTEGFPRVIKEAMYAGKACIVSRVGGLPEAIQHGVSGLLFASEDVNDLANQFRVLLPNMDLRRKLGVAAEEYAHRHYSNSAFLDYLVAFTDEVLRSWRGGLR